MVVAPPAPYAIPVGATPVFVTADKKMQYGALTITPGGFLAAESVFRSRAQNRELESFATSIPTGAGRADNETRLSGRGSRAALLIEAPISRSNVVAAYGEIDFQQVGVGSNYNQSSSFVPRIRNLYATLDNSDYGLHLLAGQSFSLATLNTKGITPRNEALPAVIDYNYVAGFVYKRQGQVRLVKDFNKKLWLAVSVENPQTIFNGCGSGVAAATTVATSAASATCTFNGAGSLAGANGVTTGNSGVNALSFNRIPDVIAKAAYEARVGERDIHLEAFGMMRDFTNRDFYAAGIQGIGATQDKIVGSVGFGIVAPLIPRRLDFQANALIGRGNASYATSQNSDVTLDPNGAPRPLREENVSAGLILHATPSFDFYAFGGFENYHQLSFASAANGFNGYGSPLANNSGCFITTTATPACAGNNKRVFEVSGGFWDKLYKGQFGEVRVGVNYEYQQRQLFQGNGATAGFAALNYAPKLNDHIVYTSLRYYPFQ